jgi:predicted O-methyltransferase YrrM
MARRLDAANGPGASGMLAREVQRTASRRKVKEALRRPADRAYSRSVTVRRLVAAARWPKARREAPDLAHMALYDEVIRGPVQRDEALLLHSLIRVTRPATLVEIGSLRGRSTFNFLRALDDDARLYAFDIDPRAEKLAQERFGHDPRFAFRLRSQTELTADDIDGRRADFVFLDAAHDFELNKVTFDRLLPLMAPRAVLAVHDTGTIPRALVPDGHWWHDVPDVWVGDEGEVEAGEREFVNWVLAEHPEFGQVHLHATRSPRCGITLLQREAPLPRPGGA